MRKHRFAISAPGAKEAYLVGDFNGWAPGATKLRRAPKTADTVVTGIELAPGRYEFKYIIDGQWCCCPHSERTVSPIGTENSVIEVS